MNENKLFFLISFLFILSSFFLIWNKFFTELNPVHYDYLRDSILFIIIIIYYFLSKWFNFTLRDRFLSFLFIYVIAYFIGWITLMSKFSYSSFSDPLGTLWLIFHFSIGFIVSLIGFWLSFVINKIYLKVLKKDLGMSKK